MHLAYVISICSSVLSPLRQRELTFLHTKSHLWARELVVTLNNFWTMSEASSGICLVALAFPYWIFSQESRWILTECLRIPEFDPLGPEFMALFSLTWILKYILCFESPSVRDTRLDGLHATKYRGHAAGWSKCWHGDEGQFVVYSSWGMRWTATFPRIVHDNSNAIWFTEPQGLLITFK